MADNKPKGQPVKLTITSCVVGYQGKNNRGDDYTIYEIQACRESGEPITDKKLRSFEDLPVGQLLELTATPFQSEKHGLSFTLSRKGMGAHQRITKLSEELATITARLDRVENWIRQRANGSQPQPQAQPPQQVQPPQQPQPAPQAQQAASQDPLDPYSQELDERFGADPPF